MSLAEIAQTNRTAEEEGVEMETERRVEGRREEDPALRSRVVIFLKG